MNDQTPAVRLETDNVRMAVLFDALQHVVQLIGEGGVGAGGMHQRLEDVVQDGRGVVGVVLVVMLDHDVTTGRRVVARMVMMTGAAAGGTGAGLVSHREGAGHCGTSGEAHGKGGSLEGGGGSLDALY